MGNTEAKVEALEKNMQPAIMQTAFELTNKYYKARDEVEADVDIMKAYFRSQSEDRYKTKADVLRALWTELVKYLLGVFDTVEDAQKAFDHWNSEYEKARADMKS